LQGEQDYAPSRYTQEHFGSSWNGNVQYQALPTEQW
jgi:hypothetical protein